MNKKLFFNYFIYSIIFVCFIACKKDSDCDFVVQDDVATSRINDYAGIDIWENDNLCPTLFPTDTAQGFRIVEIPKHGRVSLFQETYRYLYYTPDTDYEGDDQFIYELKYTNGLAKQGTVRIKVSGGLSCKNSPPHAKDDIITIKHINFTQDTVPIFSFLLGNDTICNPAFAKAMITQNIPSSQGTLTDELYKLPSPTFTGTIVFKYQICDVYNRCSEASVTLNITD